MGWWTPNWSVFWTSPEGWRPTGWMFTEPSAVALLTQGSSESRLIQWFIISFSLRWLEAKSSGLASPFRDPGEYGSHLGGDLGWLKIVGKLQEPGVTTGVRGSRVAQSMVPSKKLLKCVGRSCLGKGVEVQKCA